jgi:hypothetical protein
MRIRWHKWWLLGLFCAACSLNPQPDIPTGATSSPGSSGSPNVMMGQGGASSSAAGSTSGGISGPTASGAAGNGLEIIGSAGQAGESGAPSEGSDAGDGGSGG